MHDVLCFRGIMMILFQKYHGAFQMYHDVFQRYHDVFHFQMYHDTSLWSYIVKQDTDCVDSFTRSSILEPRMA